MGIAQRYSELIFAVQRWAKAHGIEVSLLNEPDDRHFPLVFSLTPPAQDEVETPPGTLFLFTPGEQLITSDVLAYIIQWIGEEERAAKPVILCAEDAGRIVERAMKATGVAGRVVLHQFAYRSGVFATDWLGAQQGPTRDFA
jgi:hypothetical protein